MDKQSLFKLDFNKVLIQLITPGLVAIFPYIILYLRFDYNTKFYCFENISILITAITILSLVAGLLIENIGSIVEVLCFDTEHKKKDAKFEDSWERYLQLTFEHEPLGQEYLRTVLLRMKFELSIGVALISMSIGLIWLDKVHPIFDTPATSAAILFLLPFSLSYYITFWEAKSSSEVLAKTREILVKKYWKE